MKRKGSFNNENDLLKKNCVDTMPPVSPRFFTSSPSPEHSDRSRTPTPPYDSSPAPSPTRLPSPERKLKRAEEPKKPVDYTAYVDRRDSQLTENEWLEIDEHLYRVQQGLGL